MNAPIETKPSCPIHPKNPAIYTGVCRACMTAMRMSAAVHRDTKRPPGATTKVGQALLVADLTKVRGKTAATQRKLQRILRDEQDAASPSAAVKIAAESIVEAAHAHTGILLCDRCNNTTTATPTSADDGALCPGCIAVVKPDTDTDGDGDAYVGGPADLLIIDADNDCEDCDDGTCDNCIGYVDRSDAAEMFEDLSTVDDSDEYGDGFTGPARQVGEDNDCDDDTNSSCSSCRGVGSINIPNRRGQGPGVDIGCPECGGVDLTNLPRGGALPDAPLADLLTERLALAEADERRARVEANRLRDRKRALQLAERLAEAEAERVRVGMTMVATGRMEAACPGISEPILARLEHYLQLAIEGYQQELREYAETGHLAAVVEAA